MFGTCQGAWRHLCQRLGLMYIPFVTNPQASAEGKDAPAAAAPAWPARARPGCRTRSRSAPAAAAPRARVFPPVSEKPPSGPKAAASENLQRQASGCLEQTASALPRAPPARGAPAAEGAAPKEAAAARSSNSRAGRREDAAKDGAAAKLQRAKPDAAATDSLPRRPAALTGRAASALPRARHWQGRFRRRRCRT